MEHHIAIVSFEGAVKREIKRIREQLQADETLSEFYFDIKVSGRVHEGDIKLTYKVADNSYGARQVEGDDVNAVVEELQRQRGWTARHAPKVLSYEKIPGDNTDPTELDDEIPF